MAHSQEYGILQGWLVSLNRPCKISMIHPLDHNAKGTALTIATSTCLFHLFRQTAMTATFYRKRYTGEKPLNQQQT